MSRARLAVLISLAAAAASPAFAQNSGVSARARALAVQNNPALASEDPLTRQILRQVTQPTCSVKTFVRVASGQGIELKSVELDPQALSGAKAHAAAGDPRSGLAVATGLQPAKDAPVTGGKRRTLRKATEQLGKVDRQGHWGDGRAKDAARRR